METDSNSDVPQIRSSPLQNPMQNYGSSIILLTNPENDLYKSELTFRSMMIDKEGNILKSGEPLMNDFGISAVIGQMQSIINQITIMSSLNKNDVKILIDFLSDTLAEDLMLNKVTYGIKTPAARQKIYFVALTTAYICMKRAYEGEGTLNDKRFWRGSLQEIRSTVSSETKKGGIFSKALGWGKNN